MRYTERDASNHAARYTARARYTVGSIGLMFLALAHACVGVPQDIDTAGCIRECRIDMDECSELAGNTPCTVGESCLDDIETCFDEANECSKVCTGCEDELNGCMGQNNEADCADLCTDLANECTDGLKECIDAKEACVEREIDAEKQCLRGNGGFVDCTAECIHEVETKLKNIG